jgi:hypothetical protein
VSLVKKNNIEIANKENEDNKKYGKTTDSEVFFCVDDSLNRYTSIDLVFFKIGFRYNFL